MKLSCACPRARMAHRTLNYVSQAQVIPGQRLRDIARGSGIPIVYDCQEGTCKTCEAMINNQRAKIWCARASVPQSQRTPCR